MVYYTIFMDLYSRVLENYHSLQRAFKRGFFKGFSEPGEFDDYIWVMERQGFRFTTLSVDSLAQENDNQNNLPLTERCEQLAERLGRKLSCLEEGTKRVILNVFYFS